MKVISSLGAKLALVCVICVCVVAAIAAALNTIQVDMLKKQMLLGSQRLAEEKGRLLARELAQLEAQLKGTPGDEAGHHQALMERIQLFIQGHNEVVLAAVIEVGEQGIKRVAVADYRDPKVRSQSLLGGDSFETELGTADSNEGLKVVVQRRDVSVPVVVPLDEKEAPGLHLALAVNDSETYKQIETAGALITRRVTGMAALLSGALVLAFIAVWILFKGQTRLIQENEQLNRMAYVGTLASGLAHEIRNPLNAMSVNLGVVQEDLEDPRDDSPDRIRQIVAHLTREVGQLNDTVVNFLAYALPRPVRRERVRPADAVHGVLEAVDEQLRAQSVQVRLALDEQAEIEGDANGLRQVFHNLAINALEAMNGPERELAIRSWRDNGFLRVSVADSGPGIAPEDLHKIFEPFHTAKARGTGFGLPIAQRIVRDHGGRIWAESAPGQGAVFHLEFPLPSDRAKA